MSDSLLETICRLSRLYGADADYVVAGGGNTSCKDADTLWVKGSGNALAELAPAGLVAMDRARLAAIWKASYPAQSAAREAAVLADMMAAKKPGEEAKRPSVETLLHDMFPHTFVVHLHPALVNGLTCSQKGEEEMRALFGDGPLWIPISDPGFVLACAIKEKVEKKGGAFPEIIFLQNHGVFVAGDTEEEIKALYEKIMETLKAKVMRRASLEGRPDFGGQVSSYKRSGEVAAVLEQAAAEFFGGSAAAPFSRNNEIAAFVKDAASFKPLSSPYTPDHIVYAGSNPLFIASGANAEKVAKAYKAHAKKTGRAAKIAACQGLGIFGLGANKKNAALALELFADAAKVAIYAEAFGGPLFMTKEKIDFINGWEAEHYRQKLAEKK